jgi:hypothetical protein
LKLYEPLIERDLPAIPAAVRSFLDEHSVHDLFLAVARFAVLAYSPSQHSKRAVMACRAAWDLRDAYGERWPDLLTECARYAAEARQPWSEPPILDAIEVPDEEDLRAKAVGGDALLMLNTALALVPILGEKGRGALLRMPSQELEADRTYRSHRSYRTYKSHEIPDLVAQTVQSNGSPETVTEVLIWSAQHPATPQPRNPAPPPIYPLATDYAQTLIAHATPLPTHLQTPFLAAVHHNLAHGESFADWSFA